MVAEEILQRVLKANESGISVRMIAEQEGINAKTLSSALSRYKRKIGLDTRKYASKLPTIKNLKKSTTVSIQSEAMPIDSLRIDKPVSSKNTNSIRNVILKVLSFLGINND